MDLLMLIFLIVYCTLFIHMVVDLYFQGSERSLDAVFFQHERDLWAPHIKNLNQWAEHVRLANRSYDLFRSSRRK